MSTIMLCLCIEVGALYVELSKPAAFLHIRLYILRRARVWRRDCHNMAEGGVVSQGGMFLPPRYLGS